MKSTKPKEDRRSSEPRKRFHIEKLEERVAPARGGKGTRNCSGAPSGASGSNVASDSGSIF